MLRIAIAVVCAFLAVIPDAAAQPYPTRPIRFIAPFPPGDNFTVTREDIREDYGEKRLVTFGILNGEIVVLVHTERDDDMHIISLRKAEKHEARYYFEIAEDDLRKGR